jgi:glutamate/tyrosine decarboxylase-like PLP-dependent enzyme
MTWSVILASVSQRSYASAKALIIPGPRVQVSKSALAITDQCHLTAVLALTGIGSQNLLSVPVDVLARMDAVALDRVLGECLERHQAIYAVVAIMGTTEHGAMDPISKIVALRRKYQGLGLSFLIHAVCIFYNFAFWGKKKTDFGAVQDGAWGGYFTAMLTPDPSQRSTNDLDDPLTFVSPYTIRELRHIRFADSVTIDPHKSGYVPYPAGALCYRDGRSRFLLTWNSPVIGTVEDGATRMGVYGIEGRCASNPWLGFMCIS